MNVAVAMDTLEPTVTRVSIQQSFIVAALNFLCLASLVLFLAL